MMSRTRRVWRWKLAAKDVIADERWFNWFRPKVFLTDYQNMLIDTLAMRNEHLYKLVLESTPLARKLRERKNENE